VLLPLLYAVMNEPRTFASVWISGGKIWPFAFIAVKASIRKVIQRHLATVLLGDDMIKFIADKIGCFR